MTYIQAPLVSPRLIFFFTPWNPSQPGKFKRNLSIFYFQSSLVLSDGRTVVAKQKKNISSTAASVHFHQQDQHLPHHQLLPTDEAGQGNGRDNFHLDLGDSHSDFPCSDDDLGTSLCGWLLTSISFTIVLVTLPFSLFVCFKVVQEYERAVIFRLGRLLNGGSKGPGKQGLPCFVCLLLVLFVWIVAC